jgi:hypothetical protein
MFGLVGGSGRWKMKIFQLWKNCVLTFADNR